MHWRSASSLSAGTASAALADRRRLAGQARLVDPQARRLDEAQVRRHSLAGREQHEVAGDQRQGRHAALDAVADHRRVRRGKLLQRGDGRLGPVLVEDLDEDDAGDDEEDGDGVAQLAREGVDDAHGEEQQDHRLGDLLPGDFPEGDLALFGQPVRAEPVQPFFRLAAAEAAPWVAAQAAQHLGRARVHARRELAQRSLAPPSCSSHSRWLAPKAHSSSDCTPPSPPSWSVASATCSRS